MLKTDIHATVVEYQNKLEAKSDIRKLSDDIKLCESAIDSLSVELNKEPDNQWFNNASNNYEEEFPQLLLLKNVMNNNYNETKKAWNKYVKYKENTQYSAYLTLKKKYEKSAIEYNEKIEEIFMYRDIMMSERIKHEEILLAEIEEIDNLIYDLEYEISMCHHNITKAAIQKRKHLEQSHHFFKKIWLLFICPDMKVQLVKGFIVFIFLMMIILPACIELKRKLTDYDIKVANRE